MKDHSQKFCNVLAAVILAMAAAGCEKPETPQEQIPPQMEVEEPICTYVYDGVEYPVHSITSVDNGAQIIVKISPLKDGEKQTTYAVIGINSVLEGQTIDVGRAWSNDDYYFIYESPLMYYSQYRVLQSGHIMIKRLSAGPEYDIFADVELPDGRNFKFEYAGICAQL